MPDLNFGRLFSQPQAHSSYIGSNLMVIIKSHYITSWFYTHGYHNTFGWPFGIPPKPELPFGREFATSHVIALYTASVHKRITPLVAYLSAY
jgi:hypothetical protein